ncbi:MAG: BlaI/MecI/CopY family transcriptional regulator [Roseimicrobium sp.]
MPAKRTAAKSTPAIPSISDAEWVVMTEFWRLGEATAKQLVAALEGRQHWKPRTVQSLINRLVQKQALGFRQEGREYIYKPLVDEGQCVHEASKTFVDRVFGGRLAPLLACFLEREECTPKEIEEMRRLLKGDQK